MKTKNLEESLAATITIVCQVKNPFCVAIKYKINGKSKRAVFPPTKKTGQLFMRIGLILDFAMEKEFVMYRHSSCTRPVGSKGFFTMHVEKEAVYFNTLSIDEYSAKKLVTHFEYEEALNQCGFIERNTAKVINLFSNNQKKTA